MAKLILILSLAVAAGCGEVRLSIEGRITPTPEEVTSPTKALVITVFEHQLTSDTSWENLSVRSSVDEWEAHPMKVTATGFHSFSYEVSKASEGSHELSVDAVFGEGKVRNISDFVAVFAEYDGHRQQICDLERYAFSFSIPLIDQECDVIDPPKPPTTPTTTITSDGQTKLVSLEEGWQFICNDQIRSRLISAEDRLRYITIDIEMISDPTCRAKIQSYKQQVTTPVACYVNTQELFHTNSARVWQQAVYNEVAASYPNYLLWTQDGNHVSVWAGMYMANHLIDSPGYGGKKWYQYMNDKIVEQMELGAGICDQIHFDNMNWIQYWTVYMYDQFDPIVGPFTDAWDFGNQWRESLIAQVNDMKSRYPGMVITGRAKHHRFLEVLDGVVFEKALKGPPETDIPGGWLGRISQLVLMAKSGKNVVLHHDYEEYSTDPNWQVTVERKVEEGYAVALCLGVDYSFDLGGDDAHGNFQFWDVYGRQLGEPLGDCAEPYVRRFSWQDTFSLSGGQVDGQIPVKVGDTVVFWRDIEDGVLGESAMTGIENDPDWDSGLFAKNILADSTLQLGFTGPGTLVVEDLTVYSTTDAGSTGYYYREFETGEVFVNPHPTQSVTAPLRNGKQVTIPKESGCVVAFSGDTAETSCSVQ